MKLCLPDFYKEEFMNKKEDFFVTYEEVLLHRFPVEASSDAVVDAFNEASANGEYDFSDGCLISGRVTGYEDSEGNRVEVEKSFSDMEAALASISAVSELSIPLDDGYRLVASRNLDPDYKEIFVYLEGPDGLVYQDLAIVGECYEYDNSNVRPLHGKYSVKVYSDPADEDYQYDYKIDRYVYPFRVYNIDWETDGSDADLPDEVIIEDQIEDDEVADYLSDNYGFLVNSFRIDREV